MLTLLPDIYFRVMNMSNFGKHIYLSWSRKIEFLPESNRKTFMRAGWGGDSYNDVRTSTKPTGQ